MQTDGDAFFNASVEELKPEGVCQGRSCEAEKNFARAVFSRVHGWVLAQASAAWWDDATQDPRKFLPGQS
eukprot:2878578-Amphidinium_carterae.3